MTTARSVDHSEFYRKFLPGIQHVAWTCGYNAVIHGSMQRDLDIIAIPWIEHACSAQVLVDAITKEVGGVYFVYSNVPNYRSKPHGRKCWSIHFGPHDSRYIDLSVMPTTVPGTS